MNGKRILSFLLLFVTLCTAVVGCGKKSGQPQGENVSLTVKTSAVQSKVETYAELSYEIWVAFDNIDVPASEKSVITLNGDRVSFRTDAFASDTPGSERICTGKINVKRQAGQTVLFPIEVNWFRIGDNNPERYFQTCTVTVTLDDDSVTYYEGSAETKPAETKPAESETVSPETKAPETGMPETLPPETKPAETDPPETKPTEPVNPGPSGDDPDAFTSWEIRSDTGTYMNLLAKCSAADVPGGYRIRVTLYLEHSSIFVGSRTGGALKIAGQSFPYTTPTIERSEQDTVLTFLAAAETTVKRGEVFTVSANYPFNGIYGGVPISEILIEGKYVFE